MSPWEQDVIVSLPPDLEKLVEEKVESGGYQTPDEVIAEGLRLLEQRDQAAQKKLEALRDAIRIGRESGPPEAFDIETVKAEARRAFEDRRSGQ